MGGKSQRLATIRKITKTFDVDMDLSEWMRQWGQDSDDEQVIRGTLGRLLFGNGATIVKKVKVLSGGEKGRALRQTVAVETQCLSHGRTDQPHGYGKHRILEHGAGKIQRHADFRLPRPSVRFFWQPKSSNWTAKADMNTT